jgi:threonine dehydrogenase-like Zn-dependent dehydrogenase
MGSRVLILGAGTIGLMCAMLLRDRVGEVAITARYPHQREAALKLGASAVFEPESADLKAWSRSRRPDVVIETVGGSATTMTEAFKTIRGGGTIIALGVFTGYTQINGFRLVNEEVNIIGSVMYGRAGSSSEYGVAVRELAKYRADLPVFLSARFGLAQTAAAFERAADKSQGALKVTILPNG